MEKVKGKKKKNPKKKTKKNQTKPAPNPPKRTNEQHKQHTRVICSTLPLASHLSLLFPAVNNRTRVLCVFDRLCLTLSPGFSKGHELSPSIQQHGLQVPCHHLK